MDYFVPIAIGSLGIPSLCNLKIAPISHSPEYFWSPLCFALTLRFSSFWLESSCERSDWSSVYHLLLKQRHIFCYKIGIFFSNSLDSIGSVDKQHYHSYKRRNSLLVLVSVSLYNFRTHRSIDTHLWAWFLLSGVHSLGKWWWILILLPHSLFCSFFGKIDRYQNPIAQLQQQWKLHLVFRFHC